jgi:AGZA family xanthine/uracil permease-like MFS transporter
VAHPHQGELPSAQRIFHLKENDTTVRRELLAGLTTFTTMAYVVVVNPRILSEAGMPVEGVLFATCISAALATLIMGVWANYPIALAPGMSLNAYFTYSIVIGRGVPWQTALGVVFISGMLFLLLTLTNVREMIVNGIPDCLKHGTAAGIGLFIAFIGFRNAKIIVAHPATFVAFGNPADPASHPGRGGPAGHRQPDGPARGQRHPSWHRRHGFGGDSLPASPIGPRICFRFPTPAARC